ncbi:hypothetical protein Hanom_Chr01g00066021 [Helianthus anomalus]
MLGFRLGSDLVERAWVKDGVRPTGQFRALGLSAVIMFRIHVTTRFTFLARVCSGSVQLVLSSGVATQFSFEFQLTLVNSRLRFGSGQICFRFGQLSQRNSTGQSQSTQFVMVNTRPTQDPVKFRSSKYLLS